MNLKIVIYLLDYELLNFELRELPFLLISTSRGYHSRDASSYRTKGSFAFLLLELLFQQGFWQAFRVHSSADNEVSMDSMFHL